MIQFKRGLSARFVERLNTEYESGGWWQTIANDPELFIGIRNECLNVYWKGNSLLELKFIEGELVGKTHYKYLLKPEIEETAYLKIENGRPQLADTSRFFITDFSDVEWLKRAANVHSGAEKSGVHQILLSNPNVIDVEIAFGSENEQSGKRVAKRIDFATLKTGQSGPEISFYEAKLFSNPELRAVGDKVPVLKQLECYQKFLRNNQTDLISSYKKVCGNLSALSGIRNRYAAMCETMNHISTGQIPLNVSDEMRLVVFGYDSDQEKGAVWRKHREKFKSLTKQLGVELLTRGSAKGFTRGISSSVKSLKSK